MVVADREREVDGFRYDTGRDLTLAEAMWVDGQIRYADYGPSDDTEDRMYKSFLVDGSCYVVISCEGNSVDWVGIAHTRADALALMS